MGQGTDFSEYGLQDVEDLGAVVPRRQGADGQVFPET